MDYKRRIELYAQLRSILMELLYDRKPAVKEPEGSVLRIHASEIVGTSERMVH